MDEYWQSEDHSSYCFCYDGEWYQIRCEDPTVSTWTFCPVSMDRGLPVEMQINLYHEVDLPTMLAAIGWTPDELQAQVDAQFDTVD